MTHFKSYTPLTTILANSGCVSRPHEEQNSYLGENLLAHSKIFCACKEKYHSFPCKVLLFLCL